MTYEQGLAYDRRELAQLIKAFKAMDGEATKVAAQTGFELSEFAASKINRRTFL